jgi:hypothetical protein
MEKEAINDAAKLVAQAIDDLKHAEDFSDIEDAIVLLDLALDKLTDEM